MRPSAPGSMLLVALLATLSLAAAGCDACKKKEEAKRASADPQLAAEGVLPPTTVKEPPKDFDPITPEEVMPMVPTLTGGSLMKEPQVVAGGRRVIVWVCVDGRDQAAVNPELKQKLEELGFGDFAIKTRKRRKPFDDVNWIRSEKGKFRLQASLRREEYDGCKASEGKTRVALMYMKHMPPRSLQKKKGGAQAGEAEAEGTAPAAGTAPTPGTPAGGGVDAGFDEE